MYLLSYSLNPYTRTYIYIIFGCSRTISKLSKKYKSNPCCLIRRSYILETFRTRFQSDRELNNTDLSVFSCMLGNDYIDRIKGNGPVMIEWMKLDSLEAKTE